MHSLDNENELIAKVLISNDQYAFSLLVKHYQQPLRQYCRRLCMPDHALADDIAQETFLQAFRKLSLYQGKGKLISWLIRIAYFQFLQYLRAKKTTELFDENTLCSHDDREVNADTQQCNDKRDIEQAMKILTISERHCITLQFSLGYTQEEIAQLTDVPLGTVKSHIKRGKDKLAEFFASSINGSTLPINEPNTASSNYTGAA